MSPGEYPYPADEFDAGPVGPQGVHRAPRSRRGRLGPFLLVLILFPVLAYLGVTWLSQWDGLPGNEAPPTAQSPSPTPEPTTPAPTEPAETPEPTEPVEPTTPPPTEPVGDPDFDLAVAVYNATGVAGLAGGGVERLNDEGFLDTAAADWPEETSTSVVYHASPDGLATAQTIAQTLGIDRVEEEAGAGGSPADIIVVLAEDYAATVTP